MEGFDAAIHLSGENVASGRWSAEQKSRIRDSRVKSTELLANALAGLDSPPRVFACASATGYYGDRGDEVLTEDAAPGSDFLADVSVEWENATAPASDAGIRVANMRISVVLTAAGGMVATVGPIFRLGLGGRLGSGRHSTLSWISRQDIVRAMEWILEHDDLSGPVNLCSPNPVTNCGVHSNDGQAAQKADPVSCPQVRAENHPGRDYRYAAGKRPRHAREAQRERLRVPPSEPGGRAPLGAGGYGGLGRYSPRIPCVGKMSRCTVWTLDSAKVRESWMICSSRARLSGSRRDSTPCSAP